jgi:hypothetical protein
VTFALALAWSAALLVMDLATARPRVISRGQIQSADVVVIARRVAGESDRVQVERVFRGEVAEGDQLRVLNRWTPDLTRGQDYIRRCLIPQDLW